MPTVTVNPPKTPVTAGSMGLAVATIPNICKMPGPPAPFVPVPLPNIGKSELSPKGYSTTVKIEGHKVAIRGATFDSIGDIASKATGGGLISMNTHGPTKFVGPGSLDVKIEGKNVQLLTDPMLNNNGPAGSPPNSATLLGVIQAGGLVTYVTGETACPLCGKQHGSVAQLEETGDSKGAAEKLAKGVEKMVKTRGTRVVPAKTPEERAAARSKFKVEELPARQFDAMLGVMQCQCGGHFYADHSNVTFSEFCDVVAEQGGNWHAPKKSECISIDSTAEEKDAASDDLASGAQEQFAKAVGRGSKKAFNKVWGRAENMSAKSRLRLTKTPHYTPGFCAGQKVTLLTLNAGAYPGSLTEQWYGGPTQPIRHVHVDPKTKSKEVRSRPFHKGETVPPCGTCSIILPLLLCPDESKTICKKH